jgi:beta-lactam-binding protein with PASTA domain
MPAAQPAAYEQEVVGPPGPPAPLPPEEPPPSRELWPWLLLLAIVVLGGLAIAWALTRNDDEKSTTTIVVKRFAVVPAVTGLRERQAVQQIQAAGLRASIERRRSDRPAGVVIAQRPAARAEVQKRSIVTLTVSSGQPSPSTVRVPNVVGLASAKAERMLTNAGLRPQTKTVFSEKPAGTVVSQDPAAGVEVIRNSVVTLTVSKGQQQVGVPDVVGSSEADARSVLRSAGLLASVFQVPSDKPAGTVVAQNPKGGERVAKGSRVRINVSQGAPTTTAVTVTTATTVTVTTATTTATTTASPTTGAGTTAPSATRTTTVPDVHGLNVRAARRAIRRNGLFAAVVYIRSNEPAGTVLAQLPKPGAAVKRGSRVRINVSLGTTPEPQATIPDVTGTDEASAISQLQQAGFSPETLDQETPDPSEDGVVLAQDPAGGTMAPRGSMVTAYVGRFTG